MHPKSLSLFVSVLVIFCALNVCESLKCYHCNVTVSAGTEGDVCKGVETLQKCQDPAVCVAASYYYEVGSMSSTRTVMKTCYQYMAGKECEIFLRNMRQAPSVTAKLEFSETCGTCSEDGCNQATGQSGPTTPKSAATTVSPLFIVGLVSFAASKLL